ncbi:actin-related protein 2/3 complex subunit 5 [Spinellus fusiger]|nr:actin-related protein 2/3 complex subunit 5 [Spinellus fusiger]
MSWRKIDIDQYEEDTYTPDEFLAEFESPLSDEQATAAAQTRTNNVRQLLTRGDQSAALALSLENPPYGRHLETAKATSIQTVVDVLNQFRAADIPTVIGSLSKDDQALTEVAGTGAIVRVMTDKRTL